MKNPNDRDRAGRTPLHYAVIDDPVDSANDWKETDPARKETLRLRRVEYKYTNAKRLIAAGADVNAKDDQNFTPLHFAAREDSPEVVKLLLDSGAAVNVINDQGNTPISIAVGNSTPKATEILQLLLDHGADPFLKREGSLSAIDFAKTIDDPQINAIFADLL